MNVGVPEEPQHYIHITRGNLGTREDDEVTVTVVSSQRSNQGQPRS